MAADTASGVTRQAYSQIGDGIRVGCRIDEIVPDVGVGYVAFDEFPINVDNFVAKILAP